MAHVVNLICFNGMCSKRYYGLPTEDKLDDIKSYLIGRYISSKKQ